MKTLFCASINSSTLWFANPVIFDEPGCVPSFEDQSCSGSLKREPLHAAHVMSKLYSSMSFAHADQSFVAISILMPTFLSASW